MYFRINNNNYLEVNKYLLLAICTKDMTSIDSIQSYSPVVNYPPVPALKKYICIGV